MGKTDIEAVKRGSVRGILALTSRTFILQVIAFSATLFLTVLLDPSTFGVFFVVSAIISFLGYFSDIGLAAALIQQKEEPSRIELTTTFILQQSIVSTLVVLSLIFSRSLGSWYGLNENGVWLFRSLSIAFFLSSLKTIPSVLLERTLNFNRLVIPQIAETSVFYAIAVYMAWQGWGLTSFTIAALMRGIVGVVTLYAFSPWMPGFSFSTHSARKLLSFGIPFQANSFLALIKDDLMTLFLGKFLSLSALGYIGWAKKWAEVPLRLLMDSVVRVTFPAYARLQEDTKVFGRALEKSIFFLAATIFPSSVGLMLVMPSVLQIVPRYSKWEPALVSFYLFALSAICAALSSPMVNALNAIGRVSYTLRLMVLWTTLTWVLFPSLSFLFGFTGVAIGAFIIGLSSFIPALILKKFVPFSFLSHIDKPIAATILMTISVQGTLMIFPVTIVSLGSAVSIGILVYGLSLWFMAKDEILPTIEKYFHAKA